MISTFDRYLIREVLMPFVLSLLLLTFLLLIQPMLQQGYPLIAKGVALPVVVRAVTMLMPSALSLSIPMAVLLGLLVALGRLSADREFVALQACGVSVYRLLRPVAWVALAGTVATAYVLIVWLPDANQTFREITLSEAAKLVEKNVKPRVFFADFPNQVLYVRDLPAGGGWRDVFFADTTRPGETTVYVAREGRVLVDRENRLVQLQLAHGRSHVTRDSDPAEYQGTDFASISLSLDPQRVFPPPPSKGVPEMTIAELRRNIAEAALHHDVMGDRTSRLQMQYKFSIPVACCVLALIGLALGVSNRKDGKLASFAIGFVVIFVYYVLFYMARAAAIGGVLNAGIAPWISNVVLGAAGVVLTVWCARSSDRPLVDAWPLRRRPDTLEDPSAIPAGPSSRRVPFTIRLPGVALSWIGILDAYTARQYLMVFAISLMGALGVFYISTFIDLADKLFRGSATTALLLRYFYYQTPQYVYFIIPIAGLVATLVTIGVMTKNNELVVMRACGVSLYRTALPVLLFAGAASVGLFTLQERVLARSNREATRLNGIIRGWPAQPPSDLNRWMAGRNGDIYHFDLFDRRANRFSRFTVYHLDQRAWRLNVVTYAEGATLLPDDAERARPDTRWAARNGWVRTLTTTRANSVVKTAVIYTPFAEKELPLESPAYFSTEAPEPQQMSYGELSAYVTQLETGGFNAVPSMVQLQRKMAFPFVTVIMTLLAVPFAVTTGRRGAMYGIGIGIAMSIIYWAILQISLALGEGGAMTPLVAAWAPNMLFGAAALFGILTVRT